MVYIYAADVTNLPDPKEFPELVEGLEEKRIEKTLRYRQELDRKQSFGAGLLLRHALKLHGMTLRDVHYGQNGKPAMEGICFNLSHSHEMVVCTVSKNEVGCDIEKITKAPGRIAGRFFCKNEIRYLDQFEGKEKELEFFRLWTMKESYMKMTGEGMQLALNRFEFLLGDSIKVYRDGEVCNCHLKEYDIPGYKMTVCAKESEFAQQICYVKLEQEILRKEQSFL